ncbi:MAG: diaminopimelate decarboxylase [Fimbriimonadaceae bacterium]
MGQKGPECHNFQMVEEGADPRWCPDPELVRHLRKTFGTPLYVIDETSFRRHIRDYLKAFRKFDPRCELTFASKANSVLGILKIAYQEGCLIDVASEGELRAALAAGVPADKCHLHGNNKSQREIGFAVEVGIGQIVADNFEELEVLAELGQGVEVILRLAPGVLPITNEKISTGQQDTKFGFSVLDGAAEVGVKFCLDHQIDLVGFHCHVGSQLLNPEAQIAAGKRLASFAKAMHLKYGLVSKIINVGGGRAVRYTNEQPIPLEKYCEELVAGVRSELTGSGLEPIIVQEPGRALVAESGVTIYRVGVIKNVGRTDGSFRRYIVVDGGMAENPRPALYGAQYEVVGIASDGRELEESSAATVSGWHCEVDLLFDNVFLPNDLKVGDFIVALTTGAYSSSMASNYNRFPRPQTVLIRETGEAELLQRKETFDEMMAREVMPEDLK